MMVNVNVLSLTAICLWIICPWTICHGTVTGCLRTQLMNLSLIGFQQDNHLPFINCWCPLPNAHLTIIFNACLSSFSDCIISLHRPLNLQHKDVLFDRNWMASFFLQQIRKLLSLWTISRFIHWITIIDMWNMWNISLPWTQAESFYAHAFAVKRMLLMLKNLDRPNYVTICIIYWFTVLSTWNRIYGEDYRAVR